jgi:glutathione peroxidase
MSVRDSLIVSTYDFRMKFSQLTGLGIHINENVNGIRPKLSFYDLQATSINGATISFDQFKRKKVLVVNLASRCGYTPQYEQLEALFLQNPTLTILGFPSNNFGGQESGSDAEIVQFCQTRYGVTFPLFKKNEVKGNNKQNVYQWLTDADQNGWNDEEPAWNFYKYLVDESGTLMKVASSSVLPVDLL